MDPYDLHKAAELRWSLFWQQRLIRAFDSLFLFIAGELSLGSGSGSGSALPWSQSPFN